MSDEIIELQYRQDSVDSEGKTQQLTNDNTTTQKPKSKGGKSHSYETIQQNEDEELGDIDIEAGASSNTNTATNIQNTTVISSKIKDTGGYCLLSSYVINFVAIASFMIAAFVRGGNNQDIMMILILICVLLATVLSAWALYTYGRLQDQVDRLKEENRVYDIELIQLKDTTHTLGKEIDDLESENTKLNQHSDDLHQQSDKFGDLVDELKTISKDGEDVLHVVDEINNAFDKMNDLVYQNERTHLLTLYYQAAFRDKDNDMNKKEYERFLLKIPKKFRDRFRNLGTFEYLLRKYECEQEAINLQTFLRMADDVLAQSDDVLKDEFIREYTVQSTLYMSEEASNALRNELLHNQ